MSGAGPIAGVRFDCFDTDDQIAARLHAHSFVYGTGDQAVVAATQERAAAGARVGELAHRLDDEAPEDLAGEWHRARAVARDAHTREFQARVDAARRSVRQADICGDCLHDFQQRMIRAGRCSNPVAVLPGNPRHRWGPGQDLPVGMRP